MQVIAGVNQGFATGLFEKPHQLNQFPIKYVKRIKIKKQSTVWIMKSSCYENFSIFLEKNHNGVSFLPKEGSTKEVVEEGFPRFSENRFCKVKVNKTTWFNLFTLFYFIIFFGHKT